MIAKKLQSEVYFGTLYSVQSGINVNVYCPAANYFQTKGSIGKFQYSLDLGSSWNNCTKAAAQIENDLDNIPLSSKQRNIPVVWEASTDLNILEKFTNVKVKITFYDQASQVGTESEEQILTIPEIDMRPTETILPLKPYPGDNLFYFKLKTLVSLIQVKTHFRVQVAAESDTEFANPLIDEESETDQAGWTLDGAAFPATGADTETNKASVVDVEFTDAALAALAEANYNIRVLRSLHDPAGILMPTYPDNW